jgi:DNA-binding NtrC family response regulator
LVESELFGHVKGAFSGANSDKKGLIEEAHEGTLFLDEIGELGLETQVKLLRVLETGQVRRVGDTRHKAIDFRLVCATNRDLYERTSDGLFREDLYYRIAVAKVHLPALRHRPEDIGPLAHSFLERYCAQARRPTIALSEEALAALREQRWSGNIRELRNWMQRAVTEFDEVELKAEHILTLAEDEHQPTTIRSEHWAPPGLPSQKLPSTWKELQEQMDALGGELAREVLKRKLDELGGNVTRLAASLGIKREKLYDQFRKYQIQYRPGSGSG